MLLRVSFCAKLVAGMSSSTACCQSISQPNINHLLSSKNCNRKGQSVATASTLCLPHVVYAHSVQLTWASSTLDGFAVHSFSAATGKPEEPSVCVCSPASFPWTTLPPGVTIARNQLYRLRRCDTLTVE